MQIGFFLNNLDEEYQLSVYQGVRTQTEELGISLVCVQGERLDHKSGTVFPSRAFVAADGILILSSVLMEHAGDDDLINLDALKLVPAVSIGRALEGFPSIIVKSRSSMEELMDHLISFHGYRKFLYVGGPAIHHDNAQRESIFRKAIGDLRANLSATESHLVTAEVINGEFHTSSGKDIIRDYIATHPDNPPDAIVAANDNMAIGIQEILRAQKREKWRQCALTGFDDIPQASLDSACLTTIRQPLDILGKQAVLLLKDIIEGKQAPPITRVGSELKIRSSCGCKGLRILSPPPPPDIGQEQAAISQTIRNQYSDIQDRFIKSENHFRHVSLFGQSLIKDTSVQDIFPDLQYFLTGLSILTFYLVLYRAPSSLPQSEGILIFRRSMNIDTSFEEAFGDRTFNIKEFFAHQEKPHSYSLYQLQSSNEYLGLIIYEADSNIHPYVCSAAIFIASTIKRLQLLRQDRERSVQLEKEVALRTKDLREANEKLAEESKRRMEVEAEVLRISEMERLRFSLDLHDDICQRLAGISMFCKSLAKGVSPKSLLPDLSDMIDETLSRTRRYAHEQFPVVLDSTGLNEALALLCHTVSKQGTACAYSWELDNSPFTHAQEINVYRIIQEALANVVKHSGATAVLVEVKEENSRLIIRVQDNGKGAEHLGQGTQPPAANKRREGLGLRSMQYRAHQLGADYRLVSSKDAGMLVEVSMPLDEKS